MLPRDTGQLTVHSGDGGHFLSGLTRQPRQPIAMVDGIEVDAWAHPIRVRHRGVAVGLPEMPDSDGQEVLLERR